MTRILIIDDESVFRQDVATLLGMEGYTCETAADGLEGVARAQQFRPDIVLCDLVMPGLSGVEVIDRLRGLDMTCAILVVSAHATMDTAIESFRRGALDIILKPIVTEAFLNTIARVTEQRRLRADVHALRLDLERCGADTTLVGSSDVMVELRNLIARLAPRDSPVLITGESGTGKEVVARAIHSLARSQSGPFVAVNCVAVAGTLFESELFGHAKGAFTGADGTRQGYFEAASGGTLLLDEVGEIPLQLQGKLLRAVERREIVRVGETGPIPVDSRIIGTTNRDLHAMVADHEFRTDLYYRLRVVHITMAPLRERPEDIPELVEHFLRVLNSRMNLRCATVADPAMQAMMRHRWPGNIRELQNTIERALIMGDGSTIRLRDLPAEMLETTTGRETPEAQGAPPDDLRAATKAAELAHIVRILQECGGNRSEAARRLGVDPSTLWRKLEGAESAEDDGGANSARD